MSPRESRCGRRDRVAETDGGGPPPIWHELDRLRDALAESSGLLLGLDFDGTLAPIHSDPDTPSLPTPTETVLRALRDHDRVHPAVISGRALSDLRSRVGIDGLAYSGNHGLELHDHGRTTTHPVAETIRPTVETVCTELEERLEGIAGCFVEDKGVTASVHYRQASTERIPEVESAVDETVEHVADGSLDIDRGKRVIECKPGVDWDKGNALTVLAARRPADWLTIHLGDDTTDEDAFRELQGDGIGIRVGDDGATAATALLADPDDVSTFLRWIESRGTHHLDREAGGRSDRSEEWPAHASRPYIPPDSDE